MFQEASKRLFLVLFPIALILIALYLSHTHLPKQDLISKKKEQNLNNKCPFYLGISFFSKKENFKAHQLTTYTLNEREFIKKIQDLKLYFKKENIYLKKIFFALPLTLTKKEEWIISQKTFFILPKGERKQISNLKLSKINQFHNLPHPSYLSDSPHHQIPSLNKEDLQTGSENLRSQETSLNKIKIEGKKQKDKQHKKKKQLNKRLQNEGYKVLTLDSLLTSIPKKSNFLFYLVGSDRKKIITNLYKIQNKIQGKLYISSDNEKLLKDLSLYQSCLNPKKVYKNNLNQEKEECLIEVSNRIGIPVKDLKLSNKNNIKILHSFKTLIRLELLSILPYSFKNIQGDGLIVPSQISLNQKILQFLDEKNKLLFFEQEPPYTKEDKYWIKNSQALISSQPKLAIRSIKDKKTCLIKD